jgi:hypothetical protein
LSYFAGFPEFTHHRNILYFVFPAQAKITAMSAYCRHQPYSDPSTFSDHRVRSQAGAISIDKQRELRMSSQENIELFTTSGRMIAYGVRVGDEPVRSHLLNQISWIGEGRRQARGIWTERGGCRADEPLWMVRHSLSVEEHRHERRKSDVQIWHLQAARSQDGVQTHTI